MRLGPFAIHKNGRMALQRMDNVGIVVESLDAAISFFAELGLELEVADDRVVEAFLAGVVVADVVSRPSCTELVAPCGELTDQVGEGSVVRVPAGFAAQDCNRVVGCVVPVD